MKKTAALIFLLLMFVVTASAAANAQETGRLDFYGITDEMLSADHWIARTKGANKVILTAEELAAISDRLKNTRGTYCTDIFSVPELLPRAQVLGAMGSFSAVPDAPRYAEGREISSALRSSIAANAAADAVNETVIVRFAAVSDNCILRALPYDGALCEEADDTQFDMNIVSAAKIWEPLAVLHESADGEFFFVLTPYCSGWIKKENAALCGKKNLRELFARRFAVITGSRVTGDCADADGRARSEFFMGTRLPLADEDDSPADAFGRTVLVPKRTDEGLLRAVTERLPIGADVTEGYLPYTRANVIRQAFKMLGERYGWGGTFGARDCSAFVRDVWLCFGLELPRNSSVQAHAPIGRIDASGMSAEEKNRLLAGSGAGTLVQMPGHIMMYIGTAARRPFIIHAAYSLGSRNGELPHEVRTVNCVAVTDMEMTRRSGSRIIDSITNINVIR